MAKQTEQLEQTEPTFTVHARIGAPAEHHAGASYTIADSGVLTVTSADGKRTHYAPGEWQSVRDHASA